MPSRRPQQPDRENPDSPLPPGLLDAPELAGAAQIPPPPVLPETLPAPAPAASDGSVPVPIPLLGQPGPVAPPVPPPGPVTPAAPAMSPAPAPVAPAPAAPANVPAAAAGGRYTNAGTLSAEQVITGDPNKYAHLDPRVVEMVGRVQQDLVNTGRSDDLVRARHDPELRAALEQEIDRAALTYLVSDGRSNPGEKNIIVSSVVNEILGLGPLEPLWQEPRITEVIVNGPTSVYVEMGGRLRQARGVRFRSQEHLLDVCQRILSPLNRKLDVKDPLADGRLPDGSRVNAVHFAIAPKGPLLTIRRFPQANRSLVDLVGLGAMSEEMACTLTWLVKNKASSLIVGGTGSGKTTMLNALSAAIPRQERVVTIEDSLELRLHPESHVAAMEARPADASGQNAVPIRNLVKNALRMRPDRIIVGEVRGAEALNMLEACNTGHEGSMSTVHANGPNEALARLAVMVAQGGEMPADKVDWLVGSALDLIIQIRRYKDGSRRISGIYEVPDYDDVAVGASLRTIPLWEWKRTGETSDGKVVGEYEKVNEVSARLREKLGLDFEPEVTWTEVQEMSRQ